MSIYAYASEGYEGSLVHVEVDIRRGLPAFDLTGLPDGAIKEARERVRAAVRNSGFEFPVDRILVNLAPAGLRKCGSSFDLPIALAILLESGQLPDPGRPVLALGELRLSGDTLPAFGVLPAIAAAEAAGIRDALVPAANAREAEALGACRVLPLDALKAAPLRFADLRDVLDDAEPVAPFSDGSIEPDPAGDFADLRGHAQLKRALEVAAAGGHHVMLFGPPGSGKTMAASRFATMLPDLERDVSFETTKIHSLAGIPLPRGGLVRRPPLRAPHHGASAEGMVGGGRFSRPGEISLAHGGVLFLDEAPEFRTDILQALREPIESGRISIARAESSAWYPARFQLVLAANPCPCGNLGKPRGVCLCSPNDVRKYWKRLGGPLLDRIDIRVPVGTAECRELLGAPGERSAAIRERVTAARDVQRARYRDEEFSLNALVPPGFIDRHCRIDEALMPKLLREAEAGGLSGRAIHGIARVARTVADLAGSGEILEAHVDEALGLRRYGEEDAFWVMP